MAIDIANAAPRRSVRAQTIEYTDAAGRVIETRHYVRVHETLPHGERAWLLLDHQPRSRAHAMLMAGAYARQHGAALEAPNTRQSLQPAGLECNA